MKPTRKVLPAALAAHAAKIQTAHAHLARTVPGFRELPPVHQFKATQAHVRKTKGGA